jgi:hypothetical protein
VQLSVISLARASAASIDTEVVSVVVSVKESKVVASAVMTT